MPRSQPIRFGSGSPEAAFSGVWRLIVSKDDVYIGASRASMAVFKISLHKSGVWVLAATQQSGATFEAGGGRWRVLRSLTGPGGSIVRHGLAEEGRP